MAKALSGKGYGNESATANNCSVPAQVTVAAPQFPDLVVETPTVSDNNPETGEDFTLSVTVANQGDAAAAAATLRYYRSADATISTSDALVGMDTVAALAASESSSQSVTLAAPSTAGPYYYGACVDAVPNESNTANCSSSISVTVANAAFYGAYAIRLTFLRCDVDGFSAHFAVDKDTEQVAIDAAVQACEDAGFSFFSTCTVTAESFRQCAAAVLGSNDRDHCDMLIEEGATDAEAQSNASTTCEQDNPGWTCIAKGSACNTPR